jgi:CBS domain-containing protein
MKVRELMTSNPATCTPDTDIRKVAQMMVEHDTGAIPVVASNGKSGRPVGIVTDRDIVARLVAEGRNPLDANAEDAMTDIVATVSPDSDAEEAVRLMKQKQVRRIVVVENDRCVGIVSQADIARQLSDGAARELLAGVSQPSDAASTPAGR